MTLTRLLIVDDDPIVLRALRTLLHRERGRWDMTFACGGRAALEALGCGRFDAVISDMRMPEIDGVRVMQAALEVMPTSARVMLTGSDSAAMQHIAPLLDSWVEKPCDRASLVSTIELALGKAAERGNGAQVASRSLDLADPCVRAPDLE